MYVNKFGYLRFFAYLCNESKFGLFDEYNFVKFLLGQFERIDPDFRFKTFVWRGPCSHPQTQKRGSGEPQNALFDISF